MSHCPKSLSNADAYMCFSLPRFQHYGFWEAQSVCVHLPCLWPPPFLILSKGLKVLELLWVSVFHWCFEPLWWSFSCSRMRLMWFPWASLLCCCKRRKLFFFILFSSCFCFVFLLLFFFNYYYFSGAVWHNWWTSNIPSSWEISPEK